MLIFDTTVLVHAVGREHEFRDPCRRLVVAAEARAVDARTTVEVLQEFVHVRGRSRGRDDAVARARSYAALLGPLLTSEQAHLEEALPIYQASASVGMFDAVLAAVCVSRGATLVSANRAFATISGLDHVVPSTTEVDRLLAS